MNLSFVNCNKFVKHLLIFLLLIVFLLLLFVKLIFTKIYANTLQPVTWQIMFLIFLFIYAKHHHSCLEFAWRAHQQ